MVGAAYIALTGVLLVWATRLHPTQPSTGVGIVFLALAVGQAGAVSDATSLPWVFLACAAITALGAVLGPRKQPTPSDVETRPSIH